MPSQAFAATAALAIAAAAVTCLKVSGALEGGAAGVWRTYRDVQGLLGVATLPQVLPGRTWTYSCKTVGLETHSLTFLMHSAASASALQPRQNSAPHSTGCFAMKPPMVFQYIYAVH